jgi:PAS domain S-box-containing protein
MKRVPVTSRIVAAVLLAGVLPLLVGLAAHFLFGSTPRAHGPVHQAFELAISWVGLTVALLLRLRNEQGSSPLIWVVAALVAMGIFDAAHGLGPSSAVAPSLFWLRMGSTLIGGGLLGLTWVRLPDAVARRQNAFIFMIAVSTMACVLGVIWRPDLMPATQVSGGHSALVKAANALGGLGFLSATLFFFRRYRRQPSTEDLVLGSCALMFATACYSFGRSLPWATDWWISHGFRLLSYLILLVVGYLTVTDISATLRRARDELEGRVQERTEKLQNVMVELEKHRDRLEEIVGQRTRQLEAANAQLETDITERKRAEKALRALSSRQQTLLAAIPDIVVEVDKNKVISWMNLAGFEFYGEDAPGKEVNYFFEGEQRTYDIVAPLFGGSEDMIYVESYQRRRDGAKRLLAWWCKSLKDDGGDLIGTLSTARDITERREAEDERERLIGELTAAMAKVKTLSGILPICAWCKKVRCDEGYWHQVEVYVRDHSEAEFSHGICPECEARMRQ